MIIKKNFIILFKNFDEIIIQFKTNIIYAHNQYFIIHYFQIIQKMSFNYTELITYVGF